MQQGRSLQHTEFLLDKFGRLERLFAQAPFGVCIIDTELRCRQVNQRMALIDGQPVEKHLGKTLKEAAPEVALALEPILRRVLKEKTPVFDWGLDIPPGPDQTGPGRTWQACCYPLRAKDGTVLGVSLVVQDVSERKQEEAAQIQLLRFEALLSSLSATFINLPVSEVDGKIVQGLQKIVDFLGFDRSTAWKLDRESGAMVCTHSYQRPGIKPPPALLPPGLVPVWNAMVQRDEIFKISDIDEMPDEFQQEKLYCRQLGGIRSIMFIPASVAGEVVGFITFVSYSVKRSWPDDLTQRLRMVWDIFANALERKSADQKMQKALAEIQVLKERLEAENFYLRDQIRLDNEYDEIIGNSGGIRKALQRVEQVAATDSTVLIFGETGTGKELIARAIHNLSPRRGRPMIKVNCAALPAALIESELFGHEKGAFTGAQSRQIGRFEAAEGSTIFLDEVGELPLELQAKLLRVLQEGQFERLGSTRPITANARVIAATNRDLTREVKERTFREDLYYRLNVFPIHVPPLRERMEDIPLLVWGMVEEFGRSFGKTIERIPKKNLESLAHYPWPGNIRELRNMVERAMILSNGPTLVIDVPEGPVAASVASLCIEDVERFHILQVLERTGWRVRGSNGAAELLRLKPTTLDSRMKKLGIRKLPRYRDLA